MEFLDKGGLGRAQVFRIETATGAGEIAKLTDGSGGEIRDFDTGHGHAILSAALRAEEEAVERGSFQLLHGAAAALKVMATVTDGIGISIHDDLNVLSA